MKKRNKTSEETNHQLRCDNCGRSLRSIDQPCKHCHGGETQNPSRPIAKKNPTATGGIIISLIFLVVTGAILLSQASYGYFASILLPGAALVAVLAFLAIISRGIVLELLFLVGLVISIPLIFVVLTIH